MIEKIIWQTHEWEYSDLPDHFRSITTAWKNLNTGWDYRYVSAKERSNQVKNFDSTIHKFYLLADNITQADIWRYVTVYQNGGVYTDMDTVCTTPLDYTISKNYDGKEVFATEPEKEDFVNNATFGAIKRSSTIKSVIDGILDKYKTITLFDALFVNGGDQEPLTAIKYKLAIGPEDYCSVLLKNKEKVCFKFTGVDHGEEFKSTFYPNYVVDYHGDTQSYQNLAKNFGWSLG